MQKHEDGSVTLTKKELSALNKAYQQLYDITGYGATTRQDYFDSERDFLNVTKWREQLRGNKFDITDYR